MAYSKNSFVTYGLLSSKNSCGISFVYLATLLSSTTSTSQLYVSDNCLLRITEPLCISFDATTAYCPTLSASSASTSETSAKKDLCRYPKVSALTLAPSMYSETILVNVSPNAPEPDSWIFP